MRSCLGCAAFCGVALLALCIFAGWVLDTAADRARQARRTRPSEDAEIHPPDAKAMAERDQFLRDVLMGPGGPFERIDGGTVPRLWVRPAAFNALPFDQKEQYVSIAFGHAFRIAPGYDLTPAAHGHHVLVLHDALSGKRVGRYGVHYGGLRLD